MSESRYSARWPDHAGLSPPPVPWGRPGPEPFRAAREDVPVSVRILLQGGWLVTMVPGSEPARGDLLIQDDRIAAVGRLDDVSDAEVVDARDRIVLPGLVDTHRHMWQTALRAIACDWTGNDTLNWPHLEPFR